MPGPDWQSPSPAAGVELAPHIRVPEGALRLQYARGSGPGGQNVNKVNSKAELWLPIRALEASLSAGALQRLRILAGNRLTTADEIHLACDEHRSQESNRSELFRRLRDMITAARHEPRRRKKTRPSRASKERRLESKRRDSQTKAARRRPA